MNPFRVILLVILSLSLAMMFYMVAFYLPQQKADHKLYQSMTQIAHLQGKHQEHKERMDRLAPQPAVTEESQLTQAQQEAQLAATEQQRLLVEAEERLVIAEARAREAQLAEEQQRQDREQQRIEREKAEAQSVRDASMGGPSIFLGEVHSYDAQWCILTVTPDPPIGLDAMKSGQRLVVKRGEGLVCEAEVEGVEAGLIIANVKQETLNPIAQIMPEAGDKVLAITQVSAAVMWPDPSSAQPALPQPPAVQPNTSGDKELNEVELPLVPASL